MVDQPDKYAITITVNENGAITVHDTRSGETEPWDGVMLVLGSENIGKFALFTHGHYRSTAHGFYASIMHAKDDQTEIGKHHRTALGMVSRTILELYGYFQRIKHASPQEVLDRWEKEDAEKGNEKFH